MAAIYYLHPQVLQRPVPQNKQTNKQTNPKSESTIETQTNPELGKTLENRMPITQNTKNYRKPREIIP